jgi:predicted CXXCH cytochrome family protein
MRRLLVLATACTASAAALLVGAVPAMADNGPHHTSEGIVTDTCAGCHRLHTAQAPHLLKQSQTSLCFSCHGAGGPGSKLDVVSGENASSGGALRGGGFSFALIDTGNPVADEIPTLGTGEAVTSTHSVDGSAQTVWGSVPGDPTKPTPEFGATLELRCGDCHNPHGNGNYRILRTTPEALYSYSERKAGQAPEVAIPDVATETDYAYATTNYWAAFDSHGPQFMENVAAWCTMCHKRYLASHEGDVDSGDPVYTYRHTSNATKNSLGQRNCIQCHVAHGSNAHMGTNSDKVPFPNQVPGEIEASHGGDSRLLRVDSRGVCKMCHEDH